MSVGRPVGSEEGIPEGSDDGIEVSVLKNTGDLCQNGVGGIVEISDGKEYGNPEGMFVGTKDGDTDT